MHTEKEYNSYLEHIKKTEQKYKALNNNYKSCEPLVNISISPKNLAPIDKVLDSPQKMLEWSKQIADLHLEIKDDYIPMVRVEFGTAQIAAAFGSELAYFEGSLPAAKTHPLRNIDDVYTMSMPDMNHQLGQKLIEYSKYYKANLAGLYPFQHPDVQSTFNSAHLIRGNDILYDFYDNSKEVRTLLAKVTDYMIYWIEQSKPYITDIEGMFYDSGGLWKGGARISNCSLQMISPALYDEFIIKEDKRFLKAMGGGRIHYCGEHKQILKSLFTINEMYSLEIDSQYHDICEVCEQAPENVTVMFCDWSVGNTNQKWLDKLLSGEIPKKRNILIQGKADSLYDAQKLYDKLKTALA